jgi:hypothetical protein
VCEEEKGKGRAKIEEKSPKSQTALGGGAYKQCKLPRFPFLGLRPLRSVDSFSIAPNHLKWLIEDVSMGHLVAQDLQSLHRSKNPQQASQTAPSASANPPNYGKSV